MPEEVDLVFATWVRCTDRTGRTVLSPKRRKVIEARFLDGYDLADLLDAVQGWEHDPHNAGHNDRGRPYNDLELVLRDAEHVERFRDLQRGLLQPKGKAPVPLNGRAGRQAAMTAWLDQQRAALRDTPSGGDDAEG